MEACVGPMMHWGVISEPFCVSMKVAPKRGNLIENAYIGRIIAHAFLAARAAKNSLRQAICRSRISGSVVAQRSENS